MRTTSILALLASTTLAAATPSETKTETKTETQPTKTEGKASTSTSTSTSTPTSKTSLSTETSGFSSTQLEELRKIVKEEISKNPETIMKTVQAYGEEQQKVAMKQEAEKMSKFTDDLTNDKTAIISGNPSGSIKLVIFADPNCGHCRHFENEVNAIKGEFSNVKIYTRPWAIRGQESVDVINGMVALNSKDPAIFETVSKAIASSQEGIDKEKFLVKVKEAKFDPKKLEDKSVMEDAKKIVDANKELAEKKLGLTGTPSVFLIDKSGLQIVMPGDKDSLKKLLSEAKA